MKRVVLRSIEAPGGQLCIDLFRRPDDSYGFEEYRRDPESGSGWYPIGHQVERRFPSADAALDAARDAASWLADN